MIPKIAHFCWSGEPMGWLRWASLRSFARYNPDWEIRLHSPDDDIKEFEFNHKAQEADWTLWRRLYKFGGFAFDTDIVFVRAIPDEWLDCDLNMCTGNTITTAVQMAAVGVSPKNKYMKSVLKRCDNLASQMDPGGPTGGQGYQVFGVSVLVGVPGDLDLFNQDMESFCQIGTEWFHRFWGGGTNFGYRHSTFDSKEVDPCVVGVHWYGGCPDFVEDEELSDESSDYVIASLAREHL